MISDNKKIQKNKVISESYKLTMQKRSEQMPLSLELKVRYNNCNKEQKEFLKMLFVEAKWLRNYLLNLMNSNSNFNIFKFKATDLDEIITHKDKDGNDIEVKLKYLKSSQIIAIIKELQTNIKQLSSLKKNGQKVGSLKYESEHKSIKLKQYNITHKITSYNKVKIQGCKKSLPVSGLKQLKHLNKVGLKYDLSSMIISRLNDDMFILHLTIWINRNDYYSYKRSKQVIKNNQLAIDFGCTTAFTLSTGEKINALFNIPLSIKRIQRKLNKTIKGSNNHYKLVKKLRKQNYKLTCKKDNTANQLYAKWLKENKEIIIQDEQISAWKIKHGRKIQHSILGRVKTQLMNKPSVHILNRWISTTKLCTNCGHINNEIKLCDRQFVCPECSVSYDRDIHAAQNMIWIFNHIKIGVDGSEFKREDFLQAVADFFNNSRREG